VFVSASTRCFPNVPIDQALLKLSALDFDAAEIVVGNGKFDLRPEWIQKDLRAVERLCFPDRHIAPTSLFLDVPFDEPQYFPKFQLCLRLCREIRVFTLVVKSAPVGSPYNEEFERLRKLAQTGQIAGVSVAVLTERDAISGSIDSLSSLCRGIPELNVALDPSHFIYGYKKQVDFDAILPRVSFVHLRDTSPKQFQALVGQGRLEYNKFVTQLNKVGYDGALSVDLAPNPDVPVEGELRKMRLLLESLL